MLLTLDINQMAEPVVEKTMRTSFLLRFFSFLEKRLIKDVSNVLDSAILKVEGSFSHIEELSNNETLILLSDTKKIISRFESLNESLLKHNYFSDNSVKEKFLYLNQVLYKFESLLHVASYKDAEVLKTPDEIKQGLAKLSRKNLTRLTT